MSGDWFPYGPFASATRACKSSPLVIVYLVCRAPAADSKLVIAHVKHAVAIPGYYSLGRNGPFTRGSKPSVETGRLSLLSSLEV